jgi:ABC-type multidrug transport system fused ATPase/permease subunit
MQCVRLLPEACPRLTLALALLTLVGAVTPAATIVAIGLLVGSLPATVHAGLASAAGHRTLVTLGVWAALMMLGEVRPRLMAATAEAASARVESRVQERVIAALNRPWSIAHLESPRTADLLSQVAGLGVGAIGPAQAISGLATMRIPLILQSAVSGALLFAYSWPAALMLFAVQYVFVRQIQRSWVAEARTLLGKTDAVRRADYYRDLALGAGAAKEMRVLGLSGWIDQRLRREWMSGLLQEWKARRWNVLGGIVGAVAASLAGLVVYGALAHDAASGVITLGALVIYLRSAQAIAGWGLSNADYAIEYGAVALPALCELEAMTAPAPGPPPKPLPAEAPAREIRLDNVGFAYADGAPVLRGISLSIPAGASLAVVGLNGAGKTTLVKLIARLYDPTEGAITIDGVDLRELDPAAWRTRVAAIFQDFLRFGLSARDNVGFGGLAVAGDEAALARAAVKAGALERIHSLPKGWATPLMRQYTDGADLSGGEWQRVALARAFMAVEAGAKLLILDEPTAALDVRAEAELYDRFLDLTRGLTTILISHRFSTVRRADRICVIEDGAIRELGSHAELMTLGGRYAELFTLQSQRFAEAEAAP